MRRWILEHFGYSLESRLAVHDASMDAGTRASQLATDELLKQRRAWRAVYADYRRFEHRMERSIVAKSIAGLGAAVDVYEACVALVPGLGDWTIVATTSPTVAVTGVGMTCAGLGWWLLNSRRRQEIVAMKNRCDDVLARIDPEIEWRARQQR